MINLNYVKWIQKNKIFLFCENEEKKDFLKKIGAKKKLFNNKIWTIDCKDKNDLAIKLQTLNQNKFMFAGGSNGWNPVDIFILMREEKLISGNVTEIVWKGDGETITRVL